MSRIIVLILGVVAVLLISGCIQESLVQTSESKLCGNGVCNEGENVNNCKEDCVQRVTLERSNFFFLGYHYQNAPHQDECISGDTFDTIELKFRLIDIPTDNYRIVIYDDSTKVTETGFYAIGEESGYDTRKIVLKDQDFTKDHNYNICLRINAEGKESNEVCLNVPVEKEACPVWRIEIIDSSCKQTGMESYSAVVTVKNIGRDPIDPSWIEISGLLDDRVFWQYSDATPIPEGDKIKPNEEVKFTTACLKGYSCPFEILSSSSGDYESVYIRC